MKRKRTSRAKFRDTLTLNQGDRQTRMQKTECPPHTAITECV